MNTLPRFIFSWEQELCEKCAEPLLVRRTERREREIKSIAYGAFLAVERQGYCPQHPELPPARSQQLRRIVAPGSEYAYDVLARIGVARFLECRQISEIQIELSRSHGLDIPRSTIGHLARKFIAYFQIVHRQSIGALRADMKTRGGYILHVDGTCEEGSGVMLVCMDSLSGQVLESRKIASENTEDIKSVLQDVRRDWGTPLANVHDLRHSLITAVAHVFKGTPQFICHYHLAADVGKDILSGHVDQLRRVFRRTKVRPKLRQIVRSLKTFAVLPESEAHVVSSLLGQRPRSVLQQSCMPDVAKGLVHGLASWILAFSHDGEGYGFPFDMPYLNLYERIVEVHRMLSQVTNDVGEKRGPLSPIRRLKETLDVVVRGEYADQLCEIISNTKRDRRIFERFRGALRICPKGGKERRNDQGAPKTLNAKRHKDVLRQLRNSLARQARQPNHPAAAASKIVVQHLDKYWNLLFGHVLKSRRRNIVAPRTNNIQEGLFRIVKRQCRRLHGRGRLSRDIDSMPAATPLIVNLSNSRYCQTVYGGTEPEKIAEVFSSVAPKAARELLGSWRQEKLSTSLPDKLGADNNLPRRVEPFMRVLVNELRKPKKATH
jgi:hypothetical protein